MSGLKTFFGAFKYLTECLRESLKSIDREQLKLIFSILIEGRNQKKNIIVDGQGRSLRSMLILEDCLEHNGFPLIFPAGNANIRPWQKEDIFFFNSGSGSGSPIKHAQQAKKDGLIVLGMTYNNKIYDEINEQRKGILILEPSKNKNSIYAPLGTEFELTSAVIGSCIGNSVSDTPEISLEEFYKCSKKIIDLFYRTYIYFENNLDPLMKFISLISIYLPYENNKKVYFCGVGRDAIINEVAAIRYGHLLKREKDEIKKNLRVIFEGHWDLREKEDLAIIMSGSGSTSQTLNYAIQAFISGMRIFGITSFKDSDLGQFSKRVDGCLVVPGRHDRRSLFNVPTKKREDYLPEFELNCYITFDSLLAQIASDHGITEKDMEASHRLKVLE
ncbi:MAG: hypothetical protein ACTSWY_12580 [Promethearchaeota archaeon]